MVCFILCRKESFESNKFSLEERNFFIMQDKHPFRFRFAGIALITLLLFNALAHAHILVQLSGWLITYLFGLLLFILKFLFELNSI